MKKLSIAFTTILIVAGFAFSALADPGWSNDRRWDNRDGRDQMHNQYDQRNYRGYGNYHGDRYYRDHRTHYQHRVIERRFPVPPPPHVVAHGIPLPPVPVVSVDVPRPPRFSIFLPPFIIHVR